MLYFMLTLVGSYHQVSSHILGFGLPDSSAAPRLPPVARVEANAHARAHAQTDEHELTAPGSAGCPIESNREGSVKSGRNGQAAGVLVDVAVDRLPGHGLLPRLRTFRSAMKGAVVQLTTECRAAMRPHITSGFSISTGCSENPSSDEMKFSRTTSQGKRFNDGAPILQEISTVTQSWEQSAANLFNVVAERGYTALVDCYTRRSTPIPCFPQSSSRREPSQEKARALLLHTLVSCSDATKTAVQRFTEVERGLDTAANAALQLGPPELSFASTSVGHDVQLNDDENAKDKSTFSNRSLNQEQGAQSSQARLRAEAAAAAAQAVGALRLHYDRISLLLYQAHAALDLVANPKANFNCNQHFSSAFAQDAKDAADENVDASIRPRDSGLDDDDAQDNSDEAVASVEACALALSTAAATLLAPPLEAHQKGANLQPQSTISSIHEISAPSIEQTTGVAAEGVAALGPAWANAIARLEMATAVCRGEAYPWPRPESLSQPMPTEDPRDGLAAQFTTRSAQPRRGNRTDGGADEEGRFGLWAVGDGFRGGSSTGARPKEVNEDVEEVISAIGGLTTADEQELSARNSIEGTGGSSMDARRSGGGVDSSSRGSQRRGPELRAALTLELSSALAARQRPWPVRAREVNGVNPAAQEMKTGLDTEAEATLMTASAVEHRSKSEDEACETSIMAAINVEADVSAILWARKKASKRRQGPPKPCPPMARMAPLEPTSSPSPPPPTWLPLNEEVNAFAVRGAAPNDMANANAANQRRPLLADLVRMSLAAATTTTTGNVM